MPMTFLQLKQQAQNKQFYSLTFSHICLVIETNVFKMELVQMSCLQTDSKGFYWYTEMKLFPDFRNIERYVLFPLS